MKINETVQFDHIVVGSGLAGLSSALHLARSGRSVAVLTKREIYECNSRLAQGGVACVMDRLDSFDEHVKDTLTAGAGLCDIGAVRAIVEAGPAAIQELIELGAKFTTAANSATPTRPRSLTSAGRAATTSAGFSMPATSPARSLNG